MFVLPTPESPIRMTIYVKITNKTNETRMSKTKLEEIFLKFNESERRFDIICWDAAKWIESLTAKQIVE